MKSTKQNSSKKHTKLGVPSVLRTRDRKKKREKTKKKQTKKKKTKRRKTKKKRRRQEKQGRRKRERRNTLGLHLQKPLGWSG